MFLKRPLLKASNLLFFSSLLLASPSHANDSPSSNNFELVLNTLQQVESQEVQANLLKGILDGLSGIKIISPPSTWEQLNKKLSESKNAKIQGYLMLLNQKFGNKQAIELALKTLKNKQESTEIRRKSLASLLIQKSPELLVLLKEIFDSPLQNDVIRAMGSYEDHSIPTFLMNAYPTLGSGSKRAIIETLATRKTFASRLVFSMKKGIIQKNEIPAYVARNLTNLLGSRFTDVYGESKGLTKNKAKLISQYKAKLNTHAFTKADPVQGRQIFQNTCAACHKMFNEGGIIGPDLTGSNRGDQDYILLNIIDPSFDVPSTYRMVTLKKKDGQILTGNIVEEDQQKVVLNMVGTKMVIPKSDILKRDVSKISMMPEGLLDTLNDKDFLNLIKYLQTEKQVAVTK